MNQIRKIMSLVSMLVLAAGVSIASQASAGTIVLNGSDAWEFHGNTAYGNQLKAYLGGGPIAFINNYGISGATTVNGVSVTGFASVGAATASLGDFSTLAFASPYSCCEDPATVASLGIGTNASTISAFIAGGGNLYIENFAGLSQWTSILGFNPAAGMVTGVGGVGCSDPGVATAAGIAGGFTSGPYHDGCYAHQWYDTAFFADQGYTSLVVGGAGSAAAGYSVLMARQISVVPEPASVALLGLGLFGIAFSRRKKA